MTISFSASRSGRLIGVGVGPGDPDLITTRATRTLRAADRVFAPTTAIDAAGRAEAIVRQACPDVVVERVVFDMAGSRQQRQAATESAARQLVEALDRGHCTAFVTLGDPNLYSTFSSVAYAVEAARPGVVTETVPGITAFQELAARAGTVLLDGTERLSLVTALDGPGALDGILDDAERCVVVYKGGRHLPAIAARLKAAGRLDGAVVGELLGLPGERVAAAADAGDRPATYLATVIVPPASRAVNKERR